MATIATPSLPEKELVLEHVPCNLCGEDNYTVLYKKPDTYLWATLFEFPVVRCARCGLVYVNPRPAPKAMRLYYPKGYHDNRDTAGHWQRYRSQLAFLPRLQRQRILDIGCARGDFLLAAKQIYPEIETFGIDLFSDGVKSPAIRFRQRALPECDFPDGYFNIVTAWAVFEHLHDPGAYFAEVHRILAADGRFIFLVTNSKSFYGRRGYQEDVPRHLYHFSEDTIRRYAEGFGYVVAKVCFTDKIFDGRGFGTFHYALSRKVGLSWRDKRDGTANPYQKLAVSFGKLLDLIVFTPHWESRLRRSGIMVMEFTKRR